MWQDTVAATQEERVTVEKGWMGSHRIGQLNGYSPGVQNYDKIVEALTAGLQKRPHSVGLLAALGEYEYYYEHATSSSSSKRVRTKETSAECVAKDGAEYVAWQQVLTMPEGGSTASASSALQAGPGDDATEDDTIIVAAWKKKQLVLQKHMAKVERMVGTSLTEACKLSAQLNAGKQSEFRQAAAKEVSRLGDTLDTAFKTTQGQLASLSWKTEEEATSSNELLEKLVADLKCHHDCFEKAIKGPRQMV